MKQHRLWNSILTGKHCAKVISFTWQTLNFLSGMAPAFFAITLITFSWNVVQSPVLLTQSELPSFTYALIFLKSPFSTTLQRCKNGERPTIIFKNGSVQLRANSFCWIPKELFILVGSNICYLELLRCSKEYGSLMTSRQKMAIFIHSLDWSILYFIHHIRTNDAASSSRQFIMTVFLSGLQLFSLHKTTKCKLPCSENNFERFADVVFTTV